MTATPQTKELDRPKAVTLIGRIWIVVAVVLAIKALVNLITWSVLRSASPRLLRAAEQASSGAWLVGPILRYAVVLFLLQAAIWGTVGFCAFSLLRMRPWARVAVQAVCWLNLAYVAGFLVFWVGIWTSAARLAAQDPSLTASKRTLLLAAGVGVCVLLGAALGVMLGFLRSSRVRDAFGHHKSTAR
jgi:hypothetical protein